MKVTFSGVGITEMTGKAQRIIIQKSYGGFQCRLLTIPNRRRTNATQNIRNNFAFVNSSWRSLTNEQRQTWIDAAPEGVSGFQFYSSFNLGLVNAGEEMLESFVAPVANPFPDSVSRLFNVMNVAPPDVVFELGKVSYMNAIPTGDWVPAFIWTGWIPASRYQYPRMNLALPVPDGYLAPGGYFLDFGSGVGSGPAPAVEGMKMKFQERYRNSVTGQVFLAGTYEVIAETDTIPEVIYAPGSTPGTGVFNTFGGDNYFTQSFESPGGDYDFDVWKPYFWFTGWVTPPGSTNIPTTIQIPETAVGIPSAGEIIVAFGPDAGMAPAPGAEFDNMQIALIWERVSDGYKEGEVTYVIQASNH